MVIRLPSAKTACAVARSHAIDYAFTVAYEVITVFITDVVTCKHVVLLVFIKENVCTI